MANSAPPISSPARLKIKDPKQHAQQVARQILNEPVEIVKSATSQITGSEWQKKTSANLPQTGEQPAINTDLEEKAKQDRAKAQSHMQAFQNELHVIEQLQEQRDKEREEERQREQYEKEQRKKQMEAQQNSSPLEIVGKIKRGMLGGGGKMGHVNKKQRSTELVKTPSN
jgi:hypothetical protein